MRHLAFATTLSLLCALAHGAEQARPVAAFQSIDLHGPISIEVQVGKSQSVTVRGTARFVGDVVTEVVNGELRIHMREKNVKNMNSDERVIVTVPELRKFAAEGAGETILTGIKGERFDASYRGAGSLSMSGKVTSLKLQAQGVGAIDASKLIAQDTAVDFQGIGSVQVYASGRLDARVNGMGELSYYGHPRTVTKSVSGIGSVTAHD